MGFKELAAGTETLPAGSEALLAGSEALPAGSETLPAPSEALPAHSQTLMAPFEAPSFVKGLQKSLGGSSYFLLGPKIRQRPSQGSKVFSAASEKPSYPSGAKLPPN